MKLKTFYSPKMNATSVTSFSPSASKPEKLMEHWSKLGLTENLDVQDFGPLTVDDVAIAHHPDYVRGVLSGKNRNGFGTTSREVAQSLLYTSGAILAAARAAIEHRENTLAPVSGFHHAGYRSGGGFCTFNGLMITTLRLLAEGCKQVAILDCDAHFGDGTEDILDHFFTSEVREVMTVRREGSVSDKTTSILHYSFGDHYGFASDPNVVHSRAKAFLRSLPKVVESMSYADVILYQAGADPHIEDPLGGMLTSEELAERDEIVFSAAKRVGVPVAWDLAGGYRRDDAGSIEPVLDTHTRTLKACLRAMGM